MSEFLPFIVIGLVSGSIYSLAALGLVLTYKTSGIFNFAHGAVAAVGAYLFYELRDERGLPWPVALGACVLVAGPLIGLGLERLARLLAGAAVATKIVATLGLLVAIQQLAVIRYGPQSRNFEPFLPTTRFELIGVNIEVGQVIVMLIALCAAVSLTAVFRFTRLGRSMRAVVDNPDLLALTGTSPSSVRRAAWCIGASFAVLSGTLLAPTIGLDATVLTLLVVQAFGAAAVGFFTSLPLTYAGGLAVGVGAALSTKYVGSISWLGGLPPSLPFIVLFAVLVLAPRHRLAQIETERPRRVPKAHDYPIAVRRAGLVVAVAGLGLVPTLVGARLITFIQALVYVIVFLSLALLERTSGQLSLAHLGFAAVGASTFSHLSAGAGLPWIPAVLLAALVTVPIGALVAVPAIRLSGLYLALATFGFGLLLERLFFNTGLMFGGGTAVPTPRPSFATSDTGYFYVVAVFVILAIILVVAVHRSRLGRLLRAMADSPLALSTYGTSTTTLKMAVFCVSAFLAGLAGALLGPVTGSSSPTAFGAFPSLLLVVILALQGPVGEYRAAVGSAIVISVLPAYASNPTLNEWFPVLFGAGAIAVAIADARGERNPRSDVLRAAASARAGRSPVKARIAAARAATDPGGAPPLRSAETELHPLEMAP